MGGVCGCLWGWGGHVEGSLGGLVGGCAEEGVDCILGVDLVLWVAVGFLLVVCFSFLLVWGLCMGIGLGVKCRVE